MVNTAILDKTQVNWHISAYQASQLSAALQSATTRYINGQLMDWFVRLKAIRTQFLDHELQEQMKSRQKKKKDELIINPKIMELDDIQHKAEKGLSNSRYYARIAENKYLDGEKRKMMSLSRASYLSFYQEAEHLHKLIMIRLKEVGYMPNKAQNWKVGF